MTENGYIILPEERKRQFKLELVNPNVDMSTWNTCLIVSGNNEEDAIERAKPNLKNGLRIKKVMELINGKEKVVEE
jgi:hypothetical protein